MSRRRGRSWLRGQWAELVLFVIVLALGSMLYATAGGTAVALAILVVAALMVVSGLKRRPRRRSRRR